MGIIEWTGGFKTAAGDGRRYRPGPAIGSDGHPNALPATGSHLRNVLFILLRNLGHQRSRRREAEEAEEDPVDDDGQRRSNPSGSVRSFPILSLVHWNALSLNRFTFQ